jgi:hypothetical protein
MATSYSVAAPTAGPTQAVSVQMNVLRDFSHQPAVTLSFVIGSVTGHFILQLFVNITAILVYTDGQKITLLSQNYREN